MRQRAALALVALWSAVALAIPASAQTPVDPYDEVLRDRERRGPPAPGDVDGPVAEALFERAVVLFDRGELEGAAALCVEAIDRDPRGRRAARALELLRTINRRLGHDDLHRGLVHGDGGAPAVGDPDAIERRRARKGAPVAAVVAAGTWGALNGGLLGHVLTGVGETTAHQVVGYGAAGGLVGAGVGALYALRREPAAETIHLASSLSLYGTAAALFVGLAIDPPTREAYSLNAAIGSTAGLGAGLLIAERWRAPSQKLMLRMDLGAGAAVAGTWLLVYPATGSARVTGAISVASLAGGALGARYLSRDSGSGDGPLDAGEAGARAPAPPALVRRDGAGRWSPGLPMPRPVGAPSLGPRGGPSLGLDLVSGRF